MQLSSSKVKDKSITELRFIFIFVHVSHLQRMSSQKIPKSSAIQGKTAPSWLGSFIHVVSLWNPKTLVLIFEQVVFYPSC